MKVLAWIEETAKRSLTRFGAASLWGLALFLLLSYLNLWEKDHIDLLAVLFALGNGALSSVVIKIFLEIKNRKVMPLIYLFPGVIFYGLFSLYQAKSYLILGGLGLAAALTGLLVFLLSAEKKGKSAFPPVFLAALESSGLSLLTAGAISLCIAAVNALLFHLSWRWWTEAFYFGFFVAGWNMFLAEIPGVHEEIVLPPMAGKVLTRVFLPLYGIYLLILYGYLGKIAWAFEMPEGTMNWYASIAVLGYVFFTFMLYGNKDEKISRLIRRGGILLIPIVAVQLWGVYIRYTAYGLTTWRYLSIVCTFYGIIVMASGISGKPIRPLFLLGALLSLLLTVTPANIIDVPAKDQQARLIEVLEKYHMLSHGKILPGNVEGKDRETLLSAYHYLHYDRSRETDPFIVTVSESEVLKEIGERNLPEPEEVKELSYFRLTAPIREMSVEGWKRLIPFKGKITDGRITVKSETGEETFDVGPFMEKFPKEGKRQYDEPVFFDPDEHHRLYFKAVNFEEGKPVHGEGILLEK